MPKIYGNTEIEGNVLINGSFSITGSYSIINSQSLTIQDNIIVLAHSQSTPLHDAGIFVDRGSGITQSLIWNENNSTWAFVHTDTTHGNLGNINILDYSNVKAGTVSVYKLTSKNNPSSRYLDFDSNPALFLTTDDFTNNYLRINGDNIGISELKASSVSKLSVLNGYTIISSTSGAGVSLSYNVSDYTFLSRIDTDTGTNNFVLNHAGLSANDQRLSIGTSSGTTNLHIFRTSPGGIRIEDTTQKNGYLLVSNDDGVGRWASPSSLDIARKYSTTITMTASIAETITHGLSTKMIQISVWDYILGDLVGFSANNTSSTTVDITVTVTGTYSIVIIG